MRRDTLHSFELSENGMNTDYTHLTQLFSPILFIYLMKSCKIASIEQMPTYTYLPTMRAHPPNNKKHRDHGTPLSGPKIMPKYDEDMGSIGKTILSDSWGQYTSILCSGGC